MAYRKRFRNDQTNTNLKKMRKAKNLKQDELAEKSGLPLSAIQAYEQGRCNINNAPAWKVRKLAEALKCKMESIMEDNN